MAKGFKDKDGKFRPTGKKSGISSDQVLGNKGRIKIIPEVRMRVFKIDELEPDVQDKVLEDQRQKISEFGDTFFADDEGLIFDNDEKKESSDIGLNAPTPKFFDVSSNRGTDFLQFTDLKILNEDKFAKYLGINSTLQKKLDFRFLNDNNHDPDNTSLEIIVPSGETFGTDSAMDDFSGILSKPDETFEDISEKEFETILDAINKFDKLMRMSENHLRDNYEDQFKDEVIKENLDANEMEFEADGSPA